MVIPTGGRKGMKDILNYRNIAYDGNLEKGTVAARQKIFDVQWHTKNNLSAHK